jgi:hypothetical protein
MFCRDGAVVQACAVAIFLGFVDRDNRRDPLSWAYWRIASRACRRTDGNISLIHEELEFSDG